MPALVSPGWETINAYPRMPAVGDTVNGAAFTSPKHSQTMTIFVPALVGGATLKLQAADPQTKDSTSPTWSDVKVFNLAAGGVQALAALPGSTNVTLPMSAVGAGVFRLVATSDQSGSPVNISILFSRL